MHRLYSNPFYLATKSDPRRCAEDTGDGEGGGEGGGGGDGGGGDPVEEEPALPVQLGVLGRLNLLVQLRGFDICKWDSVNFD